MSAFTESIGQISQQAQESQEAQQAQEVMSQAQGMADRAKEAATQAAEKGRELCATTTTEVENFVRRHPVWAVAATVGIGYAVGLLARELLTPPPPPKTRAMRVLEDIQDRLTEVLGPAYERASHYADDGLSAVKSGVHALGDMKLGNRIKQFFSN